MKPEPRLEGLNVVVFRIHDHLTPDEQTQCARRLEESLAPHTVTRVLLEIEGFRHMEPERLRSALAFLSPFASRLDRIAVLGSRVWIKSWIKVGSFPLAVPVEYFDRAESERAWSWVNEP